MTGIINFFRYGGDEVVGQLFYLGGEPNDSTEGDEDPKGLQNHFLKCSKPDISPFSCHECSQDASFSDGSFVKHDGDNVYNISEVETAILKYYNELAPANWDQSGYRPYQWIEGSNEESFNKYKSVKLLVDKDGDVWYVLAELDQPLNIRSTYIDKLRKHFEDD